MSEKTKNYINNIEITSQIVEDEKKCMQLIIRKPTLKRKIVQDIHQEEDYLQHIDKIIQRDFYPDLSELRTTSEYLDAIDKNDNEKVLFLERQCLDKPHTSGRPGYPSSAVSTPANFDTPKHKKEYMNETTNAKKMEHIHNPTKADASDLSLDNYLSRNTSEDNASFYQLLEEAEKKRREKMAWCYDKAAIMSSKCTLEGNNTALKPLPITHHESNDSQIPKKALMNTDCVDDLNVNQSNDFDDTSLENKQQLSLMEKDVAVDSKSLLTAYLEARPSVPKPDRVATWSGYKVHNTVMFPPEGSPLTSEELIDMVTKQRSIIHENTRFKRPVATIQETLAKQRMASLNSTNSAKLIGRFGPDGKEIRPESTPRMGGFSFVSHNPSPHPGAGNETPGMTWGEIESTPFRISTGETPRINPSGKFGENLPTFKMADISEREKVGLELTDKLRKEKRERKDTAVNKIKSHLISPSSRLSTLSPAGQRLLSTKLQRASSIDAGLRASYTPSPLRRPTSGVVHKRATPSSNSNKVTPVNSRSATPISTPNRKSITDNLLQF